ncbi:MAG: PLP-dependent aspartate aminotransferase family protein [Kangiellaceae bacterium]|nr:PLP-dependent aspartate aminotransferase family protein [Kangiellaceae bacterium]
MQIETLLTHLARPSGEHADSVNPPLVRTSTVIFRDLSAFKKSYSNPIFEELRYGRSGTTTTFELQKAMAAIENTESCIATGCGLSAIVAVLSSHAGPGRHLLISEGVYGPTKTFCEKELTSLGTNITYFGTNDNVKDLIKPETSLIYIEVPSSITMEMFDIEMVCREANKRQIPVACDSTWGTPIFFKPHSLGIDISIHAATKYINGHSDTMLGLITGSYEKIDPVRNWCDRYGSHVAPDSCWLALRGLRTLAVRMRQHQKSTLAVATWLSERPEIKNIFYPPLSTGNNYSLWRKQFSGCAGPFTVELHSCEELEFENFINGLTLFGLGTSWGGFESLVMPAIPHHLRAEKIMPNERRLVRFHIGLEDSEELCSDIAVALKNLNRTNN